MSQSQVQKRDLEILRRSISIAMQSREHGNNPFGTVLADQDGAIILEAENATKTDRDCTAHSDIVLIRNAWRQFCPEYLARCTLYTSAEPCAMCAGATVWANIRRVVYGLGNKKLYKLMFQHVDETEICSPCRVVFNGAPSKIEVIGPLLEEEANRVHLDFWQ